MSGMSVKERWRCKRCGVDPYQEHCGQPNAGYACPLMLVSEDRGRTWRTAIIVFLVVALAVAVFS